MPHANTDPQLRSNLRASTGDGFCYSLMVGAGETYIPAFALLVGLGEVAAGLVATIPMMVGATLQLVAPWGLRLVASHRRWVVLCAATQALSFVPLVIAALIGSISTLALFAFTSLYWGAGLAAGSAWTTWITEVVPQPLRSSFFATRSRLCQAGTLAGLLAGGLALQSFDSPSALHLAFAGLFAFAALSRLTSATFLAWHSEEVRVHEGFQHVSLAELGRRLGHSAGARLILFILCMQAAAQLSVPYFTPYMLRQLEFSYAAYVVMVAAAFAARMAALPLLGRFARRFGPQRLLWLGSIGIVPLSVIWSLTSDFWVLFAAQWLSGFAWAAYELATLLMFFETLPTRERTSVLSTYNFGYALALTVGSLLGGWILHACQDTLWAYQFVFALSSAARLACLALLAWLPRIEFAAQPLAVRTDAVRPSQGGITRPVLASIADDSEDHAK